MTAATWAVDAAFSGGAFSPDKRPKYRTPKITASVAPKNARASGGSSDSCSMACFPLVMRSAVNVDDLVHCEQRIDREPRRDDIRGEKSVCDA
jgi:hypothetical protein